MSASNENTPRQDLGDFTVSHAPKTAREAQQRKEEHRSNLLYGTIAVAFVIVAIICVIYRSNIIPRSATAVTINGEKYTAAEVDFHFVNNFQSFLSQNYYYLSYLGLDASSDLRSQNYSEDETWFDYFMDQTVQQMEDIQAMNDAAAEAGFTWNDDLQAQLDDTMNNLKTNAASSGMSVNEYLTRLFGSNMTRKVFEEQTKRSLLAQAYLQNYQDSLTYTEQDLSDAYSADPKAYDKVSYEVVRVNGTASSTDEDGNEIEVTDEMRADAMAEAKTAADAIASGYRNGGSLSDLADDYDDATYSEVQTGSWTDGVLMNWLFDNSRQANDFDVLEDADGSYYYAVLFHDRFREDYNTVDVRHILIQPESSELSEDDEGYDEDVQAKKDEAKQKAEDLLAQWQSGEATEDSFAQLANENSSDGGSNTNGGLYEQVYQGQMVTAFNDWCFDESRQPGDTGIVETDYGYHVMYFVGTDLPYWEVQVEAALKDNAFNTWYDETPADYTGETDSFGLKFIRSLFSYGSSSN